MTEASTYKEASNLKVDELLKTCLLAGRIMIENGSETYRVEDTMRRIAWNAGAKDAVVFTTPTGLFISLNSESKTQLSNVEKRTMNLEKVTRVNELSRQFAEHKLNLKQLYMKLIDVDQNTEYFPLWLQCIAAAIVSSTLMIIFTGQYDWFDMPITGLIGMLGFLIAYEVGKRIEVLFLNQLLASFTVGFLAFVAVKVGLGHNINSIIIGGIMPLVPGVQITNSIRDMLAGHLLTGTAQANEAMLSAGAIGMGIAIMFRFFMGGN